MNDVITLYSKDATDFTSTNKCLGPITDVTECTVTEALDGSYTLTLECRMSSNMAGTFDLEQIIACYANGDSNRTKQGFRINEISYNDGMSISISAYHVSYDLNYFKIPNMRFPWPGFESDTSIISSSTKWGQLFWEKTFGKWIDISSGTSSEEWPGVDNPEDFYPHLGPWTFTEASGGTDIDSKEDMHERLTALEKNMLNDYVMAFDINTGARQMLINEDSEGIYDVIKWSSAGRQKYYTWDNFNIKFGERHSNLSTDTNVILRYTKDIATYEQDKNLDEVYTGCIGFRSTEVDTISEEYNATMTTETYVAVATGYENAVCPKYYMLDCSDEDGELSELVNNWMVANADTLGVPKISLSIDYMDLARYANYSEFISARLSLADTVDIYFPSLNLTASAIVQSMEYDVLNDRILSIELGDDMSYTTLVYSMTKRLQNGKSEDALLTTLQQLIANDATGKQVSTTPIVSSTTTDGITTSDGSKIGGTQQTTTTTTNTTSSIGNKNKNKYADKFGGKKQVGTNNGTKR